MPRQMTNEVQRRHVQTFKKMYENDLTLHLLFDRHVYISDTNHNYSERHSSLTDTNVHDYVKKGFLKNIRGNYYKVTDKIQIYS